MNFKLENHVLVFFTVILIFCFYNKMVEGLQSCDCYDDDDCTEGQICESNRSGKGDICNQTTRFNTGKCKSDKGRYFIDINCVIDNKELEEEDQQNCIRLVDK